MKRLIMAGAVILAGATGAKADGGFWVVGNPATGKCDIVTSNPVIAGGSASAGATGYSFGSGPYKSTDDAKLARSTINSCPPPDPEKDSAQK
jgi:hypothetical protein